VRDRHLPLSLPPLPATVAAVAPLLVVLFVVSGDDWELPTGLAVLWFLVLGTLGASRDLSARLDWLVPPLLRLAEYVAIARLAFLSDHHALPAAYALIAALAYHHYDVVYRLRHQRRTPARWVGLVGGGWFVRLAYVWCVCAAGVSQPGLFAAAAVLGAAFVVESVVGWTRFETRERPSTFEQSSEETE
jgi:hypothetical protein